MTFHKNKGFTLIELLIAISLVGILGGLVVGMINYGGIRAKMRDNTRIADLRLIQNALEQYFVDYRKYPEQDYWGDFVPPAPKYIKEVPIDPSTLNPYQYRSSPSGSYYAMAALMEKATSNDGHECSSLNSSAAFGSSGYDDDFCYGVESPTVLR